MKKIFLYCLPIFFLIACDGMNDNIKEYLDRGEINYIGKPDSLKVMGGINRIKFMWKMNSDPRVTNGKIYWNDKQDSISFPIDRSQIDKNGFFSYTINDIQEGTFLFYLYHMEQSGKRSIQSEISGIVYGDIYKSTLSPRKLKKIEAFADSARFYWGDADKSSGVILTYTSKAGEPKTIEVDSKEMITTIDADYKLGSTFTYKTIFLPEKEALDQFELTTTDQFPEYVKLNRSTWRVIDFSSEESTGELPNGFANLIIDDDPNTFWHSQWNGSTAQLPHYITIDMNGEKTIKSVTIAKRVANTDLKKAHIEVSMDNEKWENIGGVEFDQTADPNSKDIVLEQVIRAKYLKLVITESNRTPFVSISEVYVFGAD